MFFQRPLRAKGEHSDNEEQKDFILFSKLNSLELFVTSKDPRILHIYKKERTKNERTEICNLKFMTSVLAVEVNMERMIVCIEHAVFICNLQKFELIHTIHGTEQNLAGVVDLSQNTGTAMIAYPENSEYGIVGIYNAISYTAMPSIVAHNTKLACVKFNSQASLLATASTKGTVIRVFSVNSGHKLFEFRRGMARYADITSLSFSADSKLLCSSSNTETIHVYKLENEKPSTIRGSWYEALSVLTTSVVENVSPNLVGSLMAGRSFTQGRIPAPSENTKCAIISHDNQYYVLVATDKGHLYNFRMENEEENLCLIRQHRIGPRLESYLASVRPKTERKKRHAE
uniref:WD_REPEATS_REGION domain-containing protein n=1 Tax=Caenorhabditis japonica TaxID=281687 RepID=A0A8R1DQ81_CAEJA